MSKQIIKILGRNLNSLKPDKMEEFKKMLCTMNPPPGTNKIQVSQLKSKSAEEIAEIIVESYTIQKGPPLVPKVFEKIGLKQKAMDLQNDLKQVATSKKIIETPDSSATTAGKKPATVKAPGATAECNPPSTSKAKTATSSEKKTKDANPTTVTNGGAGPSSKPTKKTTSKTQDSDAIAGTSQNTGQSSTNKRAPKRKLDQPEQGGKHFVDEHRAELIKRMTTVDPVLDDLMNKEILTQEQHDNARHEKTDQGKMRMLYDYVKSWGDPEKKTFLSILLKHNPALIKDLERQNKRKK